MAAYVIVEVEVRDKDRYADYIKVVPPTITKYGGKFIVRGGKAELIEGTGEPKRIVVLEFPSMARAKGWWASAEYAEPKRMRQAASVARMILVEGAQPV